MHLAEWSLRFLRGPGQLRGREPEADCTYEAGGEESTGCEGASNVHLTDGLDAF